MDDSAMIRAFMAQLIDRLHGVDAAAAVISARRGVEVSKGTISKRQAGQLEWPAVDIWAMQDALGVFCVDDYRQQRRRDLTGGDDLLAALAPVARESGEAVSAVMDFVAGRGSHAAARKEVSEALAVLQRTAAMLQNASVMPGCRPSSDIPDHNE